MDEPRAGAGLQGLADDVEAHGPDGTPVSARVRPRGALVVAPAVGGPDVGAPLLQLRHGPEAQVERAAGGAVVAQLPCPPLDAREAGECWALTGDQPAREVDGGAFAAVRRGDLVAGAATFEGAPLEAEVARVYRDLSALLAREQVHLVRVWNAVPDVHGRVREGGRELDRYMLFCRARSLAFERQHGPAFATRLSAASAVGAHGSRGLVAFVAARTPGVAVTNPRQEEAWRYPARYGPRAPSFARATRLAPELGGALLVSGTASIVGCESLHAGEPLRQLDETLSNLEALLRAAGHAGPRPLHALRRARVYVKDPSHLAGFRRRLRRRLAPDTHLTWVAAPICRDELFIEIEGVAD